MSDWRKWGLSTWNDRLLAHFFRSDEDNPPPVATLLATADEIARAAGVSASDADDVRAAFVNAVQLGIKSRRSLIEDATNYEGWPIAPHWTSKPRFVSHLIFTCVAASESSDELADEGSYVSRLRQLTNDQLPDSSLHWLPKLWENLRAWLAANPGRYRPLVLPNLGSFTRIGYSIKLAFPDRRDQKELSELLAAVGLADREPPVDRVVRLIASERERFRSSFLAAFDEFRKLRSAATGPTAKSLREHRFWAAVVEASLRGRGGGANLGSAQMSLLGEVLDDQLSLFVVSNEEVAEVELRTIELPVTYGPWRFGVVAGASATGTEPDYESIVRRVLADSLHLRPVSEAVAQGLLAFAIGSHGLLEQVGRDRLDECEIALVRKSFLDELRRLFGQNLGEVRPSPYRDWVQLREPRLNCLPEQALENTPLGRTWILFESIPGTTLRTVGGIKADDGWLGAHEVLPKVTCLEASSVAITGTNVRITLLNEGQGRWRLPQQDFEGEYSIVAICGAREERRAIRFHKAPVNYDYRGPTDPDAWLVEGVEWTHTVLEASRRYLATSNDADCARFFERSFLLGPDVGQFVSAAADAAWKVTYFAGKYVGERAQLRGEAASPSGRVANANARRRWRKILLTSTPSMSDPDFAEARRQVRSKAIAHDQLPAHDMSAAIPELGSFKGSRPMAAVERLAGILAGRAGSRAGVNLREWRDLIKRVMGVNWSTAELCTRAWQEAGLIELGSRARWRQVSVFALRPCLTSFRVGDGAGGVLSGLLLKPMVDQVRAAAPRFGVTVEEKNSVSAFVPATITIKAQDPETMSKLASSCGVEIQWLDLTPLLHSPHGPSAALLNPPSGYESVSKSETWSIKHDSRAGVEVNYFTNPNRPDYWLAIRANLRAWSYEKNIVRAWGGVMLDEPILSPNGDTDLEANHAFMPLPLARIVSVLGAGRSGPRGDGLYVYPLGNLELRDSVLSMVSKTYSKTRLMALNVEQEAR